MTAKTYPEICFWHQAAKEKNEILIVSMPRFHTKQFPKLGLVVLAMIPILADAHGNMKLPICSYGYILIYRSLANDGLSVQKLVAKELIG